MERILKVSDVPFSEISNERKKKLKLFRDLALIKQLLIETSAILYQKLQFVGVGYRAFLSTLKINCCFSSTVTHFILKYLMSYEFFV
jgi:hypothetical protein